ncbi:MAG: coproporphyrinogen III oxidase family protein [Gammaproteobacteria bacterium]|nr:coproporphyrinogen III oxidase family protein [Gammaproteobacteria bacterium]
MNSLVRQYRLSANEVRSFIEHEKSRRQSNKVLHGHPSPLYWKPLDTPVSSLLEQRLSYSASSPFSVNLYVGTPFCIKTKPAHCGFCLFPSEDYEGNAGVEVYIEYLKKEFEMYKPFYAKDPLSSIYFGGGTPNLYRAEHYGRIMGYVDELYGGIPSDIEITLEGIPQLFSENKIRAIQQAGFNRISMGVQQLNDRLIKYSGRKQTRKQVFDTLNLTRKYDLACSVDLIYGWPEQTMEDMLRDLKDITETGIHHLTHYELNIAGRSDFAARRNRELLPGIETNIEMYKVSCEFLREQGFEQVTVYDWKRKTTDAERDRLGRYDYEHSMHHFVEQEQGEISTTRQVCGIGFAAVNFHPNSVRSDEQSWIYMNHNGINDYYQSIDRGEFPVGRGFMYNQQDVKLAWLFQSMQTMSIDFIDYESIFGENLLDSYGAVWDDLDRRGWLSITENELRFEGAGQYYIPMLQSLIASKRLAEIRASRVSRLDSIEVVTE